jgi:Phosphotransferase enzyme family
MLAQPQPDHDVYRIILLDPSGQQVLLLSDRGRFQLPTVQIPRFQRIAEHLTAAVRNDLCHPAVCLFSLGADSPSGSGDKTVCQVMECIGAPHDLPERAHWLPISSLQDVSSGDPAQYRDVAESVAECQRRLPSNHEPLARLGWFTELKAWVEHAIQPLGLGLAADFQQLNASPTFALLRFTTDGPAVWFKAVGDPNLREFPITVKLAELLPGYLPRIIDTRPDWNGWLTNEVTGTDLSDSRNVREWIAAARALADMQIQSIGKTWELHDVGATDLTNSALTELVDPFLNVVAQLMERQEKTPPCVLSRQELLQLATQIKEKLLALQDLGISDTLGHLDLNPGNIVVSPESTVFLDWAEAYVGHPFFTFEYLLEFSRKTFAQDAELERALSVAYADPWRTIMSREEILQALSLTPALAVFACAIGHRAWMDSERLHDVRVAGYLRALTRRMKREVDRQADRTALWVT